MTHHVSPPLQDLPVFVPLTPTKPTTIYKPATEGPKKGTDFIKLLAVPKNVSYVLTDVQLSALCVENMRQVVHSRILEVKCNLSF